MSRPRPYLQVHLRRGVTWQAKLVPISSLTLRNDNESPVKSKLTHYPQAVVINFVVIKAVAA